MMFVSAASGYAACIAFIRAWLGKTKDKVGNFFVDLVRITTRVLIPSPSSADFCWYGRAFPRISAATWWWTPSKAQSRLSPWGPVAALEIIKHLGTNGGGFLGANLYAHRKPHHSHQSHRALFHDDPCPAPCKHHLRQDGKRDRRTGPAGGEWRISGAPLPSNCPAFCLEKSREQKHFAAMGILFLIGLGVCFGRKARQPGLAGDWRKPVHGQHGGQGGAVRHRSVRYVYSCDDLLYHRYVITICMMGP